MPQYAILLYPPAPADWAEATPEELAAYQRWAEQVEELGGKTLSGHALHPSTTATSIRGDVVTDGPFVDAKEVVAGFYVIDAPDLDAALTIARRTPAAQLGGGVEVRPVAGAFVRPPAAG